MSELKKYTMDNTSLDEMCNIVFYKKSEADKVIADLEEKLKEQTSIAEEGWKEFRTYHTSYAESVKELYEKNKELLHHKYKRSLAMAERWLFAFYVTNKCNDRFYLRSLKYRELAEHYKEMAR